MSEFTKTLIVDCNNPELVTNGDFAADSDWIKGSNWSISGGVASRPSNPTPSALEQDITLTVDTYYSVKYNVVSSSSNSGILTLEGSFGSENLDSTAGIHLVVFKCANSNNLLSFNLAAYATISLDDVSMTENFLTIQSAIDELGANGGCIIVEQGDDPYTITDLLTPASNTTIISNGNAKILMTDNEDVFQLAGVDRVTISGFEIEMNADLSQKSAINLSASTNCRFEDLTIKSTNSGSSEHSGFNLVTSNDVKSNYNIIRNCHVSGFEIGIKVNEGMYNIIDGCIIDEYNSQHERTLFGVAIIRTNAGTGHNIVTNCIMNGIKGNAESGIYVYKSDFNVVLSNIAANGDNIGINAKCSEGTVIGANVCDSNQGDGIRIEGEEVNNVITYAKYSAVVGNVLSDNGDASGENDITVKNYSQHNCIAGNVCNQGYEKEIKTESGSSFTLIDGNICIATSSSGEIESNSSDDTITCNVEG